jgi:hypothetical protein
MLKTKMKNKKIMDEKLYSPYAKQEQTEEAIEYFRNVQRASYGLKTMKPKPTVKEKKINKCNCACGRCLYTKKHCGYCKTK